MDAPARALRAAGARSPRRSREKGARSPPAIILGPRESCRRACGRDRRRASLPRNRRDRRARARRRPARKEAARLFWAGTARLSPDCAEEGERLLREAHALVRPFGTTKTLARCLSALASARLFAGDLSDAHSLHRQALDVYRDLGEGSDDHANS